MIYDDSNTVTKYATETIAYAIFIQPARSIQADANLSFILRMDFDLNYVFWVDTSNVFTAGLTAARDFEIWANSLKPKYPELSQYKILSHALDNNGAY